MNATTKIARFGATLALALTLTAASAPTLAFADDENSGYDPSAAPFVLTTVNGGVQTAATGTEFGLGTGAGASGEQGLATAAGGTDLGAGVTGLGLGIPAGAIVP